MTPKLEQTKLNAISAKILHRESKAKYEWLNGAVAVLTIIVPILFIIAQYVTKGTTAEELFNYISFGLSLILICISIWAIIWKITDKITTHKVGIKNNSYVASECDNFSNLSDAELEWFYRYVNEIDNQDLDTFASVNAEEKKKTYREALKEFNPGDYTVVCPLCKSSPWKFKKGNCQLCGNTQT
jgi:mobilome CxxCx(11)CxxC protein